MRKLTRLVVPTEAAAQAILSEVGKGKSLDDAARSKGLTTSTLGPLAKPAVADQTAPAVANAAFAAARGKLLGPVKGALGWELVRVDAVETRPAKSLDQARGEILAQLTEVRRRDAFAKFAQQLEDQFDKGGALSDAAHEVGVTLQETPPLTADGQVYGQPGQTAPKQLARVVQPAFAMERESAPQLAEIDPGKTYVIFDVSHIAASAPAPLAEIRQDVVAAMQAEKGYAAAKAAGLKLLAETKAGKDLAAAIAALGMPLPPVTPVSMDREQLSAGGRNIPPALGLMFSMAQGTTKLLPGPRNGGWLVVSLKSIQPGTIAGTNDPAVTSTAQELSQLAANEYVEELRNAIRAEVGVTRNEAAIKAVVAQATGSQ
jgi:peptidyl-prolyl cis-trans isomerase D